jgi:putative membrane protein
MLGKPFTRLSVLVALGAALSFTAPGFAQIPAAESTKPPASRPDPAPRGAGAQERKFITEAALGGLAEVEGGQLAARKATAPDVKAFAERMVKDHGEANEELKRIATAKGVELPTQLDRKHRNELERLQKLSGSDFDRAYMKHMVEDHKKDVTQFRKAAKDLKDAEVKQFASGTLPTLEDHLRMAQKVAENVKAALPTR